MTTTQTLAKRQPASATGPTYETVLSVHHWTDALFSFRISRPAGFRFRSGAFVMLGLEGEKKPIMRAYSIASPSWDDQLEFFSIKVPDGPLTSRLQKIQPGDTVMLGRKPVGTLVLDALTPGETLYLLSTGTGFAPFASIIRDPETYEKFKRVIVTHTCRHVAELAYSKQVVTETQNHEFLGELVEGKLDYFDSATREPYFRHGRITTLIENGQLFESLDLPSFDSARARVMICGSSAMLADTRELCQKFGLNEGSNAAPAEYVYEKAFVG